MSRPRLRAVIGVALAGSLLAGGLAAFADQALPADCPATYTDPAGDSGLGDPGTGPATADDDLDIVAVTHSVDAGVFTTSIKVVKLLASGPGNSFADRVTSNFTRAKKEVTVVAERDFRGVG